MNKKKDWYKELNKKSNLFYTITIHNEDQFPKNIFFLIDCYSVLMINLEIFTSFLKIYHIKHLKLPQIV